LNVRKAGRVISDLPIERVRGKKTENIVGNSKAKKNGSRAKRKKA